MSPDALLYRLLYRIGFKPWEERPRSDLLEAAVAGPGALQPGRALDIGCGTGPDAVYVASHGWRVTAVDMVEKALAQGEDRAEREGVEVDYRLGDVTDLHGLGLGPGYSLLYDFGCIHGLPDRKRRAAIKGVTELAAPGATLILLAFHRGRRAFLPRGMDPDEVSKSFGEGWEPVDQVTHQQPEMPRPIRRARPIDYRLIRRA